MFISKKIMKKHRFSGISLRISLLLIVSALTAGCSEYYLETHKPSWLGESIYKQLEAGYTNSEGTKYSFSTFLHLIDDLNYSEVLKLTGSKTLFVADDAAFNRFYLANSWGVRSYEDITLSQKKLLLNSAMINNAYLIELMSSVEGPVDGQALRRSTALSVIDTITFQQPNELPANNKSWDAYRESGIFLVKDNTPTPMVHFLQRQMDFKGMTDEDFSIIFNGKTRSVDDAHIFGLKVLEKDITCKNGYIDILEDVLVPADNMAEVIRTKPEVQVFSNMLDRFCAPYYNTSVTNDYRLMHPEFEDSIFTKKYFSSNSSNGANLVNNYREVQAGYLDYDPGWNTYNMGGTDGMQADMGVIFAPSNDVIDNFFSNGGGKFLIEKYGTVDNIPNLVLVDLLKNHMKPSFLSALPHNFDQVLDDGKQPMGITNANIVKSYLADNGVVYVTNKVYAPASYVAVTAPILVNDSTKVFNYEVKNTGFDAYLLSMDSWYSFAVPWDRTDVDAQSAGIYYIDPVSYARKQPEIFRFRHNAKNNTVTCVAFKFNPATGTIGDSIPRVVSATEITDRFEDILDYHIVIGDIGDGKEYYRTKGGGEIKIVKNGITQIIGGGNLENRTFWPKVTRVYDQSPETNGRGNGKTYFLNAPLLPPYRSVYKILSDTTLKSQFGEFFKLLQGSDQFTTTEAGKYGIFYKDPNYAGMDFNVRSFNTFHYTVYVPTNQAVLDAIDNGLPTWDLIKQQTDPLVKDSLSKILSNFLKYHFQDNSIYIDGSTSAQIPYETAAFTTSGTKAYYRLYTKLTPSGLSLYNNKSYTGTPVNVIKDNDLYNVMARDYKFNNGDIEKATLIETSSYAVIHQIDNVLLYQNNILMNARQLVKSGLRKTR